MIIWISLATDRQTALALTRSVLLVGTGELLFIYLVIRQG